MSLAEAKAHFAEAVKKAQGGERVLITLVPLEERGLAALAGGWQGSDELVARIGEVQRARTRTRRTPRPR